MATPPRSRLATKNEKLGASAVRTPVTVKRNAARMRSLFRPKRSLSAAGDERADETADEGARHGPADLGRRRQAEEFLVERLGPADDDPVVAEKEAAHGRDEGRSSRCSACCRRGVRSSRLLVVDRHAAVNVAGRPGRGVFTPNGRKSIGGGMRSLTSAGRRSHNPREDTHEHTPTDIFFYRRVRDLRLGLCRPRAGSHACSE